MYVSLQIPTKLGLAIVNRMERVQTSLFPAQFYAYEWYVEKREDSEDMFFCIDGYRGPVFDDIKNCLGTGVWNRLKKMPVVNYTTQQESWKWYERETDRSQAEQKFLFRGRLKNMSLTELEMIHEHFMDMAIVTPSALINSKVEMIAEQIKKVLDHQAWEAREVIRKVTAFKAQNAALIQRASSGSLSAAKAKYQLRTLLFNQGLELHHLNDQE